MLVCLFIKVAGLQPVVGNIIDQETPEQVSKTQYSFYVLRNAKQMIIVFLSQRTQQIFTCSKPTIEILRKDVKYVQS